MLVVRTVVAALATFTLFFACSGGERPPSAGEPVGEGGIVDGGASLGGASGEPEGPAPGGAGGAPGEVGGGRGGAPGAAGEPSIGEGPGGGGASSAEPAVLELTGATTHVHDPSIVKEGDTYYLFSTGQGIAVRTSNDLRAWRGAGSVFLSKPSWITTTAPEDPNNLWAPEVRYFGGKFHLYYSASKFGSNRSCIGHATRTSLAVGAWEDEGEALICSNLTAELDDYNAIDPSPFEDESGKRWLAFGSFWGGVKLIRLDADGRRDGPDLFSLSTRENKAVEAPHLHFYDGYYYLFQSVDSCCRGASSTYKIMVGRSRSVVGPYVDADGTLLTAGGGTLVLEGAGRWRGPGHNAILVDQGKHYDVYHSYDAESSGVPTLRIARLAWTSDGWPLSAGP